MKIGKPILNYIGGFLFGCFITPVAIVVLIVGVVDHISNPSGV